MRTLQWFCDFARRDPVLWDESSSHWRLFGVDWFRAFLQSTCGSSCGVWSHAISSTTSFLLSQRRLTTLLLKRPHTKMKPETFDSTLSGETLRGQHLTIPNLQPAFASWKQGINPLYEDVRQAVDQRLEGLIENERVLQKVKAADIGLFASGSVCYGCTSSGIEFDADPRRSWFPDVPYETLETVAFYCIWLFLWDDAIDGSDLDGGVLVAEEYCQKSVAFVRHSLGLDGPPGAGMPSAPTKVCESFAEVGRRVCEGCDLSERKVLFGHLSEYMEACVTEYRWRQSGQAPSVDEFYSWRLGTSSVDVMLDLCRLGLSLSCHKVEWKLMDDRMLNHIDLPEDILRSNELRAMSLCVNKLLIL